jgi:hypothetical protein
MLKSRKFFLAFFVSMLLCYQCRAEPPRAMETLLLVFLCIAAVFGVVLGIILKYILYKIDYQIPNWIVFLTSFLISVFSLYMIFK